MLKTDTRAASSQTGATTYTSEKTDAARKPAARSALVLTGKERVGWSRALLLIAGASDKGLRGPVRRLLSSSGSSSDVRKQKEFKQNNSGSQHTGSTQVRTGAC